MIINAKNEKEAIQIAMKELGGIESDYTTEILAKPKKSLLNVVKKMGTYKITFVDTSKKYQKPLLDPDSSYVSIEEGKVIVHNPREEDNLPLLYVNHGSITLKVNDELVKSHISLKESDVIDISFDHVEPITHVTLALSEDKMEATLKITRHEGKSFYLKDMHKTNRGYLDVDWEMIPPQKVTIQQCLEILKNAHVKESYIDMKMVHELINNMNSCSNVVAKGIPLIESQAPEITYSPALLEKNFTDGLEPIVNIGDTLAIKTKAAIPGKEGMTLTGQEIKPKVVKDILLQAGDGASLVEEGNKVISNIKGRPYLKKGIITVVPVQFVNGDLSKDIGDIIFEGDVVVKGNVLDEMIIHATGSIEITGSVYHSEIIASCSVLIHGKAIGCKIHSGADKSKLYLAIPALIEISQNIIEMFRKIKSNDSNHSQDKLKIIHKYNEIIESQIKIMNGITSIMDKEDMIQINNLIKKLKNSLMQILLLKDIGFKNLLGNYNEMIELIQVIQTTTDENVCLSLSYAQGCDLNSCGNIILNGKGSYQTNMVAQNEIIYSTPMSVIKGGTIIAGSKIEAGIIGTPGEIHTECRVLQDGGSIKGSFYRGTVIYINNVKQDISTI